MGGMQNNIRSFRVEDELWLAASEIAKERGESLSADVLRPALEAYVAERRAEPASNICPVTAVINFPIGPPVVLHCAEVLGHTGKHRGLSHEPGPGTFGRWVSWNDDTEVHN